MDPAHNCDTGMPVTDAKKIEVVQKPYKVMPRRRLNNGMIKTLFARRVIIADSAAPRIAHDGKDEIILHRGCIHDPINITQSAMFPQTPRRLKIRQSFAALLGLGGVHNNNFIRLSPRLKRERHGCTACFRRMNKNMAPPV